MAIKEKPTNQLNSVVLKKLRIAVFSLLILAFAFLLVGYDLGKYQLQLLLAVSIISLLVNGFLFSYRQDNRYLMFAELCVHIVQISVVIIFTGLAVSPWLFLYLLLAMSAAVCLNRDFAFLISFFAISAYLLSIELVMHSSLGALVPVSPVINPEQGLIFQILALFSGMVLVASATNFLRQRLLSEQGKTLAAFAEVKSVLERETVMLDSLEMIVLLFDPRLQLIKVNSAARIYIDSVLDPKQRGNSLNQLVFQVFPDLKDQLRRGAFKGKTTVSGNKNSQVRAKIYQNLAHNFLLAAIYPQTQSEESDNSEANFEEQLATLVSQKIQAAQSADPAATISIPGFIGTSQEIQKVFRLIEKVAPSESNILIYGESGTGKELVAKSIFKYSQRNQLPFVVVNCGAIPENLIESQLFGHLKGAFTGATGNHRGYFQQANGGTIFLDEIGELPLQMQVKLLRVIQNKMITPIGSEIAIPAEVRVIAATNKNLIEAISNNQFREDLYYRLNVIKINMPALKERRTDLPLLIEFFVSEMAASLTDKPQISATAMEILLSYHYPGNIRELKNIIEHACVLGGQLIEPHHLPKEILNAKYAPDQANSLVTTTDSLAISQDFDLDQHLKSIEARYLQFALEQAGGTKTKAAESLGLNFRSFRYRLQKFGIEIED